jgi:S-formylglutathione hydrolase FrmB
MIAASTFLVFTLLPAERDADAVIVSEAKKDANGFLIHEVRSPYQSGTTQIRILLPDKLEKGRRYPVIYVLPVEAGVESRFGDGLREVQKRDLHNKFQAIFAAPTFSHLPWYADHPSRAEIRQETYFLKVVVPYLDNTYPVKAEAEGRLLLGFSKSGWGAFSLLLRHPDQFGKAAAWDAPLRMTRPDRYGSGEIFGNEEDFQAHRIDKLLEAKADKLQKEKRLTLLGYGNFRDQHEKTHAQMNELKIRHEYRDGPARKHDWHSGWVEEAAELLLETTDRKE